MTHHTPGPWHVSPAGVYVQDETGLDIVALCNRHTPHHAANAALIAAAPKLLTACKLSLLNVQEILVRQPAKVTDPPELIALRAWRDVLKEAIANAKGGAQ